MVRETRLAPKMSITFGAGYSDGGEGARRPSHTIATLLVEDVCGITYAHFVKRFTHKSLRHLARYCYDQVMVSLDIILQYINFLSGVDLHLKPYVVTGQALIYSFLIVPKIFLISDTFGDPPSPHRSIPLELGRLRTTGLLFITFPIAFIIWTIFYFCYCYN